MASRGIRNTELIDKTAHEIVGASRTNLAAVQAAAESAAIFEEWLMSLLALGALLVGQLESFSSFWASAFKEVLVFALIIPVLWWRSLRSRHVEDEE